MSLTVGAIVGGIGSSISNIGQGALTIIRILAIVGFATIFAGAIMSLIGLLASAVSTSIVGEFFAIISRCLPFDPAYVFGSVLLITDGILVFLIARKVYELTTDIIGKTS